MSLKYNPKLVGNAQYLRKNMTDEEKELWYKFLKLLPMTVNRQKTSAITLLISLFQVKILLSK
jgi:very-short-patch-repair endonuclease